MRCDNVFNDFVMLANTQFVENVSENRGLVSETLPISGPMLTALKYYLLNLEE